MSDQGISVGGVLSFLLERDGLDEWLGQRRVLSDLYWGRDYTQVIDQLLGNSPEVKKISDDPVAATVEALIKGDAVAIYTGRMEFGPRALGTRTVLASPVARGINDSLNARMERSEFMPFAPVILEEHADEILDLPAASRYSARFMTITCQVKPHWRDRIQAVVHVDGTARPQLIKREDNPLYYDIVEAYFQSTGIPVLVNTSFNVHEDPIINSPQECMRALLDDRVDSIVTQRGLYQAVSPKRPPVTRHSGDAGCARR
jgi:carbamoyltransferase